MAFGGVEEDLEEGAGGGADDIGRVAGDEEEDGQEDEAGEDADGDAGDHDFRAFNAGVGDFFDHVRYGVLID